MQPLNHNTNCVYLAALSEGSFYPRFKVAARQSSEPNKHFISPTGGALTWLTLAQSYCAHYSRTVHPIRLPAADMLALASHLCEYYEQHIREEDEFQAETLAEKATL